MDETVEKKVTTVESNPKVVETTTKVVPPVTTEHPQKVFTKKKAIFRMYQIIWYVLGVIEVLLGFRITLKALGANPASGFVDLIYTLTDPLVFPFSGILRTSVTSGSVFEWSTIIAAIVYAVVAVGLVHLIQLMKPVSPREVSQGVDNA